MLQRYNKYMALCTLEISGLILCVFVCFSANPMALYIDGAK